jgi:hypothetical protein
MLIAFFNAHQGFPYPVRVTPEPCATEKEATAFAMRFARMNLDEAR